MFQIVALSFNHPEITARCLRSILRVAPHHCPILIHNGSEKKHIRQLKADFPGIQHLILSQNAGYTVGANAGISLGLTKNDWVLFLTNDCELLNVPQCPTKPGIFAAHIRRKKTGQTEALGGLYDPIRGQLRHVKKADEFVSPPNGLWSYVPGHAFLVHGETWAHLHGFDEGFFTYLEDVDLSIRARHFGLTLGVLEDFQVLHAGGKTCRKIRSYSAFYFQRNRRELLRRYSHRPFLSQVIWLRQAFERGFLQFVRRDWEGLKYTLQTLKPSSTILKRSH